MVGYGNTNLVYDRTRVLATNPPTFVGRVVDGYDAWSVAAHRLPVHETAVFADVALMDGALVLARDGAIVVGDEAAFPAVGAEHVVLADTSFASVAVTEQRVAYAASAAADAHTTSPGVEVGIASEHGGGFVVDETVHDDAAPVLPLVTVDLDGDGVLDVVGGAKHLIVWASGLGHLAVIDAAPRAVAKDMFLADDGVYRINADLSTSKVLDERADMLAVTDLDGNGVDDVAVADVHGDEVRVYLR